MTRLDELDIVLRRKGEKMVAGIPSLRLYATGDDTAGALAALEEKKKAFQSDLEASGFAETFDVSDERLAVQKVEARSGELRMFALKSGIVIGFVAVAMILIGGLLAAKIDETIFRTAYAIRTNLVSIASMNVDGPQFWSKVDTHFARATALVDRMSAEEQQKMLANVRTVVSRVRPFAAEFAPLLTAIRAEGDQASAQNCKQ